MEALNERMAAPGFWDRPQEAQQTVDRLKVLKKMIDPWHEASRSLADAEELVGLLDENQSDALRELQEEVARIKKGIDTLEFQRLLSNPLDPKNAILSINAGAGGTESCDWAEMLFRMYQRWAEQHDYRIQLVEYLAGEEAGIKNATMIVQGSYAYGYLRPENGVHRLVRISPFDSNKRRHTSFASVEIMAEVEDIPEVEVDEADLRIDAYRAGGAGGQHVNKTSSAIRITHIPTGIVVQCQNERSQHQNKMVAMKVLKSRLFDRYREERKEEMKDLYGEKKEIAWGSQIRSYVFHPYSMVKDHRTLCETSNVQAVMDGDLDDFIQAYLKKTADQGTGQGK